jgi:hypothetical protein
MVLPVTQLCRIIVIIVGPNVISNSSAGSVLFLPIYVKIISREAACFSKFWYYTNE